MTTSRLSSFDQGLRVVVFGASGGIGSAFCALLDDDPNVAECHGLSRSGPNPVDVTDEAAIARAAERIGENGPVHLIINATGMLHTDAIAPEKSLRALDPEAMHAAMAINAFAPALIIKHFHRLLPRDRKSAFASLSARVGSIADNRLGGWYSYRASKAAQNMFLRSAAIEVARLRREAVILLLHPGTVETGLSEPFAGERDVFSPGQSASKLLDVINWAGPDKSGHFFDYDRRPIPY